MSKTILVTYASPAGSSAEVADFIGQTLRDKGHRVDVVDVKQSPDPAPYDAVITGGAIRAGAWLPEAVTFVETHKETLIMKPLAYWTVCLTLNEDTPENRSTVEAYLEPVRAIVPAQSEAFFAGVMDLKKLAFPLRLMMRAMKAPQGDFRQWDDIRAWVESLEPLIADSDKEIMR